MNQGVVLNVLTGIVVNASPSKCLFVTDINLDINILGYWRYFGISCTHFKYMCDIWCVYIGLAGLLMVILLWVLFTTCHLW